MRLTAGSHTVKTSCPLCGVDVEFKIHLAPERATSRTLARAVRMSLTNVGPAHQCEDRDTPPMF